MAGRRSKVHPTESDFWSFYQGFCHFGRVFVCISERWFGCPFVQFLTGFRTYSEAVVQPIEVGTLAVMLMREQEL